jgi:hypothetical protein
MDEPSITLVPGHQVSASFYYIEGVLLGGVLSGFFIVYPQQVNTCHVHMLLSSWRKLLWPLLKQRPPKVKAPKAPKGSKPAPAHSPRFHCSSFMILGIDAIQASYLPHGFEDRMKNKGLGLIIRGWAPSFLFFPILPVGAFMTHCGWNWMLESITMGVPLITWLMFGDHHFNSKQVVEQFGVGVQFCQHKESKLLSNLV